jgi:hypothetical protein
MRGTYHRVGPGEDLLFLAEIYYGDSTAWGHIFWANWDVYGDDFEMVPAGSDVYIPDLEVAAQSVRLRRDVAVSVKPIYAQASGVWGARYTSENLEIRIEDDTYGDKQVVFRFGDKSVIMTGPTGLEYTADRIGTFYSSGSRVMGDGSLTEGEVRANTLSNAKGDGSYWEFIPEVDSVTGLDTTGAPKRTDEEVPLIEFVIPNLLRLAVEEYIGHHYFYFDALDENGFSDGDIFKRLQQVKIPPRGKRHLIAEAGKWRERLGYS